MYVSTTPARATRREWIGLAVLGLPCILATMDLTVLNLAVPHLSADLKPTTSQLLWIMDMYGFMIAGSLIIMGTLGDRIGRRKVLLWGAVFFGIASVLAAFSRSAAVLIATRGLLGIAGATLAPSTLSLIRNMFRDERQRMIAISIWVSCFSAGAAIGPVLGGVVLQYFHWGSVFLLNVPVMVLLLILGPHLLPEYKDPHPGRLDVVSAAMSVAAVLPVIYGLKRTAEYGFALIPFATIAIGSVVGFLFVRRQKRMADPFIDLNLFRSRAFSTALFLNLTGCFVAFGIFLFIAQYMQLVLGLTPLQAGLWSAPAPVAFTIGSNLVPQLVKRYRPVTLITYGLVLTAIGFSMIAVMGENTSPLFLTAALFIYTFGFSPIFTLSADLIVGSAPPERAGAAASLNETSAEFGGAVGMAVLGSAGMAIYRSKVADTIPTGLPPEALKAAKSTLGAAVEVAQRLDLGPALLNPSRAAFVDALHFIATLCTLIVIGMIIVGGFVLGGRSSRSTPSSH